MKHARTIPSEICRRWLSAVAAVLLTILSVKAANEPLTVAIFDFDAKDEPVRDLGPKIATMINAALSVESDIITVERAELQKALGEQEMSLSGTVSADTAAKVGNLTGAKVLVTGRVFHVDKERVIVAKIISTETSRVYGELSKASVGLPVTDQAAELAKKIAATIAAKGDTLVAKVETREQLVERLKKKIGAAKLPSVSVKIPEQHFGAPVRDPAAETELLLILQQCGFTIVDDKSGSKADIEVTGEAFSALGTRKGNLISCKSRVEIKAHDLRSRTLLLADRQTSVAVDIAEQTAAKTALQNAATEMAERVVIKLAK
jgi:hypothetical protein